MRLVVAVVATCAAGSAAKAEPASPNLVYAEALGKAGAYGVGYERTLTRQWAIGGAASFLVLRGERLTTVAPYVHATLLAGRANALFGELGAAIVHDTIPSPVMDWHGMSTTGVGALAGIGWQHDMRKVVLRTSLSATIGRGGVGPMVGFAIGFRP